MPPIFTLEHHELVSNVLIGFSQLQVFRTFSILRNIYLINRWELI